MIITNDIGNMTINVTCDKKYYVTLTIICSKIVD